MSVIAAFEFDDHVAAGKCARQAHRGHRCFGSGTYEPNHFYRRDGFHNHFAQFDFQWRRHPIARSLRRLVGHRCHHIRMCVAQNQRAPRTNVIEIFPAIDVVEFRSPRVIDHQRRAAHRAKRANRAVHSADQSFFTALEDLRRSRPRLVIHFLVYAFGSPARHYDSVRSLSPNYAFSQRAASFA